MSRTLRPMLWGFLLAAPLAASAADARRGEALYLGSARMENGGAPCLACHGVAGHGLARAASFGPDLTGAHATFGAEALAAALEEVPFPSMQPVYNTHALTPSERADVVAFLAQADGGAPPHLGPGFAGAVAFAMALFLGGFVWIGRRGAARRARGETP
jgi:mono/diheme cytochrome c family protein